MNLSSLSSLITRLTHSVDSLEVLRDKTPVYTESSQDRWLSLGFEIAKLHTLIDDLNTTYVEMEEELDDQRFEAATH